MEATTINFQRQTNSDFEPGFGALPRTFNRLTATNESGAAPGFAPPIKRWFVPRVPFRNKFALPFYAPRRLSSLPGFRAPLRTLGGISGHADNGTILPTSLYPVDTYTPGADAPLSGLGEVFMSSNQAVPFNLPNITPSYQVAPPVPIPMPIISINPANGQVQVARAGEPGVLQTVAGLIREGLQTYTAVRGANQYQQGQTYQTQQQPNGQYAVNPNALVPPNQLGTIDGTVKSISQTIAANPLLFGGGLLAVFLLFRDPPGSKRR